MTFLCAWLLPISLSVSALDVQDSSCTDPVSLVQTQITLSSHNRQRDPNILIPAGNAASEKETYLTLEMDESATDPQLQHFWPCKNANLLRNGVSLYAGPRNISTALWEWTVPGHTATQGHIESTPLIDGNSNVYIATTTGGIFALSRQGTQLWEKVEEGARILTPALFGDSLYVHTSQGVALSLKLTTGEVNWRMKIGAMAGGDASSATATVDTVFFPVAKEMRMFGGNDVIVALNRLDGSAKWTYEPGQMIYNFMPAVVEDKFIFIDHHGSMYCLDIPTGTLLWQTEGSQSGMTTAGVSVGTNGMAYTNFNTNGSEGGRLQAYDIETGASLWNKSFALEASAAPVVGKLGPDGPVGVVVGLGHNVGAWSPQLQDGQATIKAFDATSGAELWRFESPSQMLHGSSGVYSIPFEDSVPDTWSNSAIGSDGIVYVGWEGGQQFALDGATGTVISTYSTGWGTQGEPAIAEDFVVIPTVGKVVAFGTA